MRYEILLPEAKWAEGLQKHYKLHRPESQGLEKYLL